MLALIPISTVPCADVPRGCESTAASTPNARSAWRRFMEALMRALSAMSV
jgi:hypothetical protein